MSYILGIDTGGTYTDSVVIRASDKQICYKSKTLTTKRNLRQCIETCFSSIPRELLDELNMVCLSTTLATNAIVENHGCREGLILIGSRPQGKLPTNRVALIQGRYDIKGRIRENLDIEEVNRVVEEFRGQVDAIAVSGYASVRNPMHERYVKKVIEQKLDIPVVCAHELTSTLGFYDRTVTADLNARLIPLVCSLMDAVKLVMRQHRIHAPLMIVKGDGSLMTDICARSKPIDTILSGPAASVIGGVHLSGLSDAFVLDMGGTTTDIANVEDGKLKTRGEGARIGGWMTQVQAAEVFTVGLGGDSRIYTDSCGVLQIGPEKSIPVSTAGTQYPDLIREIGDIYLNGLHKNFCYQDEEAYQLIQKDEKQTYTDEEKIIIEVLRYHPHTLHYLENNIKLQNLRAILDALVRMGVVGRISLTPTDILHAAGEYCEWNTVVAELCVKIEAARHNISPQEYMDRVRALMVEKLDCTSVQAAMYFDHQDCELTNDSAADYFLNRLFFQKTSSVLSASFHLGKSIVAIGAPAAAWASSAGGRLHTELIVPEHAEVANAVGAAVGKAVERVEILIRKDSVTKKFLVYSPINRMIFDALDEATAYASKVGRRCIEHLSEARNYQLESREEDVIMDNIHNGKKIFIERLVTLTAHFETPSDAEIEN